METTSLEAFREELLKTGGYETPEARRAAVRARPGAWTTVRFTWGVSKVFPMCAFDEMFGGFQIERWAHHCFYAIQMAERLGMNVKVEGFQNRRAYGGPVTYLCNHMATAETVILPPILLSFGPLCYVAKASLTHLPFLANAAEKSGMIGLGRKSPREDLMYLLKTGADRMGAGASCLIFPQGTRSPVFSRRQYSSIGAKLAEKAGCPVVPLVVDTRCQPTRKTGLFKRVFKDFGPVNTSFDLRVACGPVIPLDKSKVMHEAAFDWMASKLEEWNMPVER